LTYIKANSLGVWNAWTWTILCHSASSWSAQSVRVARWKWRLYRKMPRNEEHREERCHNLSICGEDHCHPRARARCNERTTPRGRAVAACAARSAPGVCACFDRHGGNSSGGSFGQRMRLPTAARDTASNELSRSVAAHTARPHGASHAGAFPKPHMGSYRLTRRRRATVLCL